MASKSISRKPSLNEAASGFPVGKFFIGATVVVAMGALAYVVASGLKTPGDRIEKDQLASILPTTESLAGKKDPFPFNSTFRSGEKWRTHVKALYNIEGKWTPVLERTTVREISDADGSGAATMKLRVEKTQSYGPGGAPFPENDPNIWDHSLLKRDFTYRFAKGGDFTPPVLPKEEFPTQASIFAVVAGGREYARLAPNKAVKPGDTWTVRADGAMPGFDGATFDVESNVAFAGYESLDGKTLARCDLKETMSFRNYPAGTQETPIMVRSWLTKEMVVESKGVFYVDPATSRVVRVESIDAGKTELEEKTVMKAGTEPILRSSSSNQPLMRISITTENV